MVIIGVVSGLYVVTDDDAFIVTGGVRQQTGVWVIEVVMAGMLARPARGASPFLLGSSPGPRDTWWYGREHGVVTGAVGARRPADQAGEGGAERAERGEADLHAHVGHRFGLPFATGPSPARPDGSADNRRVFHRTPRGRAGRSARATSAPRAPSRARPADLGSRGRADRVRGAGARGRQTPRHNSLLGGRVLRRARPGEACPALALGDRMQNSFDGDIG